MYCIQKEFSQEKTVNDNGKSRQGQFLVNNNGKSRQGQFLTISGIPWHLKSCYRLFS